MSTYIGSHSSVIKTLKPFWPHPISLCRLVLRLFGSWQCSFAVIPKNLSENIDNLDCYHSLSIYISMFIFERAKIGLERNSCHLRIF